MLMTLLKKILKNKIAYLFILPSFVAYFLFLIYPLIRTFMLSFYKYKLNSFAFVGINNYIKLAADMVFRRAVWNTFLLTIIAVPTIIIISILIASFIINKSQKLRSLVMGIFYLPAVTSIVTICITWRWIYNTRYGILNSFLNFLGIESINWLGDSKTALSTILVVLVYISLGIPIILFTSAMGAVPKTYYEASDIDGANDFQKLWYITIPLIKPTTLYLAITLTIGLFQTFVIVRLMTGGGPYYATTTISFYLVQSAFYFSQYGFASTIGIFLLALIAGITILQYKFLSSEVEY